jgi:hypothetical protein
MSRPCLCDRCGLSPWAEYRPGECRLCWLFHHDVAFQQFWSAERPEVPVAEPPWRALPCVQLGEVLDRRGCPCPGLWLRECRLHGPITLQQCKTCPDYEEDA